MAYDNSNGFAFISRNQSDNEKAPYFKGFIKLSPQLIEYIKEAETDTDGNIKLEMSLWRKENGCSGSVTQPYVKGGKAAKPVNKPQAKKEAKGDEDF